MTVLVGGYTSFEEHLLVAIYYTSNRLAKDEVSFAEAKSLYALDDNTRWLNRAMMHFVDFKWAEGPLLLGDVENQPIELTAAGLRQAEELIAADKIVLDRIGSDPLGGIKIPASDRIVSLNHNQLAAVVQPIDDLVGALDADNGDPDQPGFREQILGEVRAGRELIRARTFRSFLLYETLVRALGELIKRYSNPTIVALANALLGALVSEILQAK